MKEFSLLQKEIESLKDRVHRLEKRNGVSTITNTESSSTKKKKHEPGNVSLFFAWLREDWLMKLGAFLLILALAWFVRYAFINDWLGPIGRVSLGILSGALIMTFGHTQMKKRPVPGQVLMITGEIMMLLTLFAAQQIYSLFPSTVTLAMMVFVVIATALLSILHKSRSMAVTALIGGALAPFMASSGSNDIYSLLWYMVVLDLGVLAVVTKTGWRFLTLLALFITALYSGFFWEAETLYNTQTVWIFMGAFFTVFFASNLAAMLNSKKICISDLIIAGFNGLLLLIWVSNFVPEEMISIVLSALSLVMVGVSSLLLKRGLKNPLYIYAGLALVFIGTATAFELDGAALAIAISLEALAAIVVSSLVLESPQATRVVSGLQIIPMFMAFDSLDNYSWRNTDVALLHEHFFVLLVVILSFIAGAYTLTKLEDHEKHPVVSRIHMGVASFLSIMFVWLCLHKVIEDGDIARGVALVIYTLVGVGGIYMGTRLQQKALRIPGAILLSGVVLRLLMVEVWQMALTGRIVTFVAIGVLLISTAFFEKKSN